MPGRLDPLVTDEFYHIFNRAITNHQTYTSLRDYKRFTDTFKYYQLIGAKPRYSYFSRLPEPKKQELFTQNIFKKSVEIVSYCLMPNHFHFLLRQTLDGGITKFISQVTNSYTRYFNTKNRRAGSLFQGRFKAVHIENEEQLIHVSRYIHLNPYSSGVVKTLKELPFYAYSSFADFLNPNSEYSQNIVAKIFKTTEKYRDFVLNQADHQRQINYIKHLTLDLELF